MKAKKQSSLSQLLAYAGKYKRLTVLGCILSGIAAVLTLAPFICIWFVVRQIFAALPNITGAQGLTYYGWLAVWFALGSLVIYFAALMCTHLAAFRTARNMRIKAVEHLVSLPLGFFSVNQSGRLRKLIDDNANMTEGLLAHQLPDLVGAIVTPVAAIGLLFVFDWRMGLICLVPMILAVFLLSRMMGGKNADFFHKYQIALEDMSGEAVEYVRGIPVVKTFQQTVYSFKNFYQSIMRYNKLASDYSMSCRMPMTGFTTLLNGVFALLIPVAAILLYMTNDGWGILLDFIFYILFTPACAMMMTRIMYCSESLMQADEAVQKLNEVMLAEPLPQAKNTQKLKDASVRFDKVTFTYPNTSQPALKRVSFTLPQGSTVAFVGPSGGGKTTVASLIPRFWDAQEGRVLVGGVDVRELDSQQLMQNVAFVFQDTHLWKTSLLENIRAACPNATRQQVLQAAKAAQCDDILQKLPEGIDTVIGAKGIYLSGGEQQRVALARAILKDAPIIVLDEATAFADPENEYQIQKAFEQLTRGKTVLLIAHRLSTVKHADNIIVLQEGEIVEQGTHETLLQADGTYAQMWRNYQTAAQWKVGKGENFYGA